MVYLLQKMARCWNSSSLFVAFCPFWLGPKLIFTARVRSPPSILAPTSLSQNRRYPAGDEREGAPQNRRGRRPERVPAPQAAVVKSAEAGAVSLSLSSARAHPERASRMAFTSRASRQTSFMKTSTPQEVGPGSYNSTVGSEQIRGCVRARRAPCTRPLARRYHSVQHVRTR